MDSTIFLNLHGNLEAMVIVEDSGLFGHLQEVLNFAAVITKLS